MTEILLDKGYQVHGLVRPSSQRRQALARPMRQGVTLHFGDVCDGARMVEILCKIEVDEIYHLAAQSHVGASFETPLATCETNAMGTLRLLEAMRVLKLCDKVRFYNVSPYKMHNVYNFGANRTLGLFIRALWSRQPCTTDGGNTIPPSLALCRLKVVPVLVYSQLP